MSEYIPDSGDIVWLYFSPQTGHEQAGRRPALVLSPKDYNDKTNLMVCCPMTRQIKGYPFEVIDTPGHAVLSDQVKSLDWRARSAQKMGKAKHQTVVTTKGYIKALIGLK